jgi:hypothetical protein
MQDVNVALLTGELQATRVCDWERALECGYVSTWMLSIDNGAWFVRLYIPQECEALKLAAGLRVTVLGSLQGDESWDEVAMFVSGAWLTLDGPAAA